MTTVEPEIPPLARTRSLAVTGPLAVAGLASLGAGAIHAAAIGVHSEHRQAVIAFSVVAAFQLGWGALALTKTGPLLWLVGLVGNVAVIGGWLLAKIDGISFVEGLEEAEAVQLADGLAAGFAAVSVLAALAAVVRPQLVGRAITGVVAIVVGLVAVPGMVSAGDHRHEGSHGHDDAAATVPHEHEEEATTDETLVPAVVPPTPYDPTKPINLSGVDGVTPEQQARAENLIAVTLYRLPQFADPATAEAAGFRSIGDAGTGYEHFVNWSYINDDKILDPDYPESVVYRVENGQRTLEAAMYMLPQGSTLQTVPDIGGPLTQWHIHDNLCFIGGDAPRVVGLTEPDGTCRAPLIKFEPVPMIHVWTVSHPCGPFAALEGVGAGQIAEGEERLCDHVHGASS